MNDPRLTKRLRVCAVLLACAAALLAAPPAWSAKPRAKDKEKDAQPADDAALREIVDTRINSTLDQLEQDGKFDAAKTSMQTLFDQVIRCVPDNQKAVYRESAFALRLVSQLAEADAANRVAILKYLRANPELAHTLVFLIRPDEKPKSVYALLHRLIGERGQALERYATLTAAVCVVHDKPLRRRINENSVAAPDPLVIFDYFVSSEKRLLFGLREVPAELLVFVVDTTAGLDEMQWALNRYAGDGNVGKRFFDVDYDWSHFKHGEKKEVTTAGFNLPNILKYGGICADQAYFAVAVGKAIGVPTTYTTGRSSESSHAWVGYLATDGKQVAWNFNSGRYEAYQGVKGEVMDPQSGKRVPDSTISLLAGLSMTPTEARRDAVALTDAAERLMRLQKDTKPLDAQPLTEGTAPIRAADSAAALALLESAVKRSACYSPAWFAVQRLADQGRLNADDKKKWAAALERLCGDQYPDFFLAVLAPMIKTVPDAAEQNRFWEAALKYFDRRFDLAAEVRFEQGRLWEEQKKPDRAGMCYEDVINRFADAGPFVLEALDRAEKILVAGNRQRQIPQIYEKAWSQTTKPKSTAEMFYKQSNWYQIGKRYADRLTDAGLQRQAADVQRELDRLEAGK